MKVTPSKPVRECLLTEITDDPNEIKFFLKLPSGLPGVKRVHYDKAFQGFYLSLANISILPRNSFNNYLHLLKDEGAESLYIKLKS